MRCAVTGPVENGLHWTLDVYSQEVVPLRLWMLLIRPNPWMRMLLTQLLVEGEPNKHTKECAFPSIGREKMIRIVVDDSLPYAATVRFFHATVKTVSKWVKRHSKPFGIT